MRAGSPGAWRWEGSRGRWRDRRPSGGQLGRRWPGTPWGSCESQGGWAEGWKVPVKGRARTESQLVWVGRAGVSTLLCGTQRHRMKATPPPPLPDARLPARQLRGCQQSGPKGRRPAGAQGPKAFPSMTACQGLDLGSVTRPRGLLWLPGHPEP